MWPPPPRVRSVRCSLCSTRRRRWPCDPGVAPVHAGYVYCAVISICRALCDWGRATELDQGVDRYCERGVRPPATPGSAGSTRGKVDRLHGQLAVAEHACCAVRACASRRDQPVERGLGIQRLGGDPGASRRPGGCGRGTRRGRRSRRRRPAGAGPLAAGAGGCPGGRAEPQPLTRGPRLPRSRAPRVFLLPVHVTACIGVGDEQAAAGSVAEVEDLARRLGTPGPAAAAAVVWGIWRSIAATPTQRSPPCGRGSHLVRSRRPLRSRGGPRCCSREP